MANNYKTLPYLIQVNQPISQSLHLTDQLENLGIHVEQTPQSAALGLMDTDAPIEIIENSIPPNFSLIAQNEEQPCLFQIVYPQDLNLGPAYTTLKRGRPKKKKTEDITLTQATPPKIEPPNKGPKISRTRSGRLVKLPKHIEKDFKKIETSSNDLDVQVSDFHRVEEKENAKLEFAELQTRKRIISAQYKCPKCFKAYLGKNKMIQHLKKYPDHGPLPEGFKEYNFDVWNYLFDMTQKCKPGKKGEKFCEELSNLLHNIQLLKSSLFKPVTDSKSTVQVDKVLGNAIGLAPGNYKFDENELYKDVTVLKLITNSDFFKPNGKQNGVNAATGQSLIKDNVDIVEKPETSSETTKEAPSLATSVDLKLNTPAIKSPSKSINSICQSNGILTKPVIVNDSFAKKIDDNQIGLQHADLLTENLLLNTLPNARNPDELLLQTVDNTSGLLDNSTSSDEVINVDQFVNERFKKIIEPDIELGNHSLNLDLPSLDLFQFHTN